MNRTSVLMAVILAAGLLVAAALLNGTPQANAQSAGGGRYHVVATDKAFILYDTNDAGKSWILTIPASGKRVAWKPIKKLDSDSEVQNWDLVESAKQQ